MASLRSAAVLRRFHQFLLPKRVAVIEACLIGLVSALSAGLMGRAISWLGSWRIALANQWSPWLVLPSVAIVASILSGWLIQQKAPEASGSGISQVKAVLARVPMPLTLQLALVKLVSAILALAGGLALGREGPTAQVGAALAGQLSHWLPTSPEHRRQLIAAGVGAGLAATFNAPIAGVLFVAEELLQDVSGSTLGTAILASFIGSSVARLLGSNSLELSLGLQETLSRFSLKEVPCCLLLGLLAGALGALFNRGIIASLSLQRRYLPISLPWRMALAGLISGLVVAALPEIFRNYAQLREALQSGNMSWQLAALGFVVYFGLVMVGYGSGAPGGLLVPSLLLGAFLGLFLGTLQADFLGLGMPTTFARVGMGAFMAATAKAPITAIVIVFELTRDFNLVLPLMIAAAIAYLASERLHPGSLYDGILALSDIYLQETPDGDAGLADLTAADVMQKQVETLESDLPLAQVMQVFSQSRHRGFPVVEASKLVGIVTQSDLQTVIQQQLAADTPLGQFMTPSPVTVVPTDTLADVLYLLNRYNLSRLPVVENRKLVGIITRSDVIRAEASELSGERAQLTPRNFPSFVVYQTQAPVTGQGRVLVPLANPQTADALLQLAGGLARQQQWELECLQVIALPRHNDPTMTPVQTTRSRRLLRRAEHLGLGQAISVHTQIRVGHDVAQAILDTIRERHIDLLLMGWEGQPSASEWIFGSVVDTLIRQAPCDVVLVKLATQPNPVSLERWLVPIAGGPNSQRAIELLPGLVTLSRQPEVRLCQVFAPGPAAMDKKLLAAKLKQLQPRFAEAVSTVTLCSPTIADAIVDLSRAEQDDVILLGASRESLLQRALRGNIPQTITRNSNCTIVLVRGAQDQ